MDVADFRARLDEQFSDESPELKDALTGVADLSPFFGTSFFADPDLSIESLALDTSFSDELIKARYLEFVRDHNEEVPEALRLLRNREMLRIIFRDLTGASDLSQTTRELSNLADFCIQTAIDHYFESAKEKYGTPVDENGREQNLVVLAMGKLGAYELNLSSDVDLIFFYQDQGTLEQPGGKELSYQEFYIRMARQVIACLDSSATIDSVFRVDMRLRPYGDSGPLVQHRAAMEKYYLEQGRDWERYAFIKARVSAGDFKAGEDFLTWIKPFIYRRHLDYGAVQSLREMKSLITRQVELKELNDDLKLGPGGIREVEFIAQAHQLIWGGKYGVLQENQLLVALARLQEMNFLSPEDVRGLTEAYVFLRNSEHAIQAENDRQTHALPVESVSQDRLARAMSFSNYDAYLNELEGHRQLVTRCFTELMESNTADGIVDIEATDKWITLWNELTDKSPLSGFDDADAAFDQLASLKQDVQEMHLDDQVMDRLDQLMPILLATVAGSTAANLVLERMLAIVRSVLRRSTYLVFLLENLDALKRAVELMTISSWIAEQLEAYPILLYELTDRSIHEVKVTKIELEGELRETLRSVEQGDLETQMDTLRQYKLATTLKVAALELLSEISIMQASDGLTALAEVILDASLELAWYHLEAKHGVPCDEEGKPLTERFAIVGYGKAGGLELAYGSDLDLVFLSPSNLRGDTDGKTSVNNNVFFLRLGQRVIHILTSFTRFGVLYEADLRLRPQGAKGPLVATLSAFERYLEQNAWTWEKQALVRARYLAGDPAIGEAFRLIREKVLNSERDKESLRSDVLAMREKMRTHLASDEDNLRVLGEFNLKHDSGAIVDIEFMVQYAVLAWAASYPQLSRWTDVMRLLDELDNAELLTDSEVETLQRAYLAFRAAVHHGWLGLDIDFDALASYRQDVFQVWEARMLT